LAILNLPTIIIMQGRLKLSCTDTSQWCIWLWGLEPRVVVLYHMIQPQSHAEFIF